MSKASEKVVLPTGHKAESVIHDPRLVRAIPVDCVPLNTLLTFSLYVQVSNRYVLFRNAGDKLSSDRLNSLLKFGVQSFHVLLTDWKNIIQCYEALVQTDRPPSMRQAALRLRNLIVAYQESIEGEHHLTEENFKKMLEVGEQLGEVLGQSPELATSVRIDRSDTHQYYLKHSVNVAIYSLLIGQKQGLNKTDVRELTSAALFHNVGNLLTPQKVLYKSEGLTELEWEALKLHTLKGASLLTRLNAPEPIVQTALHHHERIDGMGYPNELTGESIHLYSRITTIADVYDALTSPRPHNDQRLSPAEAIDQMQGMRGKFDPRIFLKGFRS